MACQVGPAFFFPPAVAICPLPSPKAAVVVARRTQLWLDEEAPLALHANANAFRDSGVLFISDTGFDKYQQLLFLCWAWIGTAHMHEPGLVLNFSTGENI